MDAYGSVLVDQGLYTKRNNPSAPVFRSCNNNVDVGFLRRSASHQLLSCHGAVFPGTRPPLYATSPVPAPAYWSSLPPPHLLHQPSPPLLPLPMSRSFSLPSPSRLVSSRKATGAATACAANRDQKKPRSSPVKGPLAGGARPHKEPSAAAAAAASSPGWVPKSATATLSPLRDGAASEGDDFTGDVYALSPPPSSLPMPRFSLRARTPSFSPPSSSCHAEAPRGAAGGIDAGASGDLRQLLRL